MPRQGCGLFRCAQPALITLAGVLRHAHWCHIWLAARSKTYVIRSGDWPVTICAMVCSRDVDCLHSLNVPVWGLQCSFHCSIIFSFFSVKTLLTMNFAFVFDMDCRSSFAMLPVEYEYDWDNLTGTYAKHFSSIGEVNKRGFSNTHHWSCKVWNTRNT